MEHLGRQPEPLVRRAAHADAQPDGEHRLGVGCDLHDHRGRALACIILAIGRHWRELGFIVAGLAVEASVSFTTSTLITRTRPNVPRLDAAQPTGSFPSGHTAAAIVLYVSLAIVITSLVRNTFLRALAWLLAIALPIYVGFSRLYQGMHHPTDLIGSVVIAAGSLLFGLLACRTAGAVADRRTTGERTHHVRAHEGGAS